MFSRQPVLNGLFCGLSSVVLLSIPGVNILTLQYWLMMGLVFGVLINSLVDGK